MRRPCCALIVSSVVSCAALLQAQVPGLPPAARAPVGVQPEPVVQHATPFQLAFAAPIEMQMLPETWDVVGVRLDVIYGCNHDVGFLDLGLLNETTGKECGLQVGGLWNGVQGDTEGVQVAGLVNVSGGNAVCQGVQVACVNLAGAANGMQLGVVNDTSGAMCGLQIGLVNVSEQPLNGLQIGLINLNENGAIPFMPIMNFGF